MEGEGDELHAARGRLLSKAGVERFAAAHVGASVVWGMMPCAADRLADATCARRGMGSLRHWTPSAMIDVPKAQGISLSRFIRAGSRPILPRTPRALNPRPQPWHGCAPR